ncbi:MAG TPA: biotin/lipoyl-containing protein, partial [Burkholderiales bacterium]|nr:biotin/lipoyl-containing protein [Burkholderiales bacterium]
YAEDPARDFLPATGHIVHLRFPEGPGIRVDAGVESGGEITPWYDPMIAKLIVHGADRKAALARLRQALAEVEIAGVTTNVAFLRRVAASRAFGAAELDTGLIERNRGELFSARPVSDQALAAAALAELAEEQRVSRERAAASGDPHSPWNQVDGWRLNEDSHHDFTFLEGDASHRVRLQFRESGLNVSLQDKTYAVAGQPLPDGSLLVRLDDRAFKARAVRDGADWHVFCDGDYRKLSLRQELAGDEDTRTGSLAAPMPGKVIQVMVSAGARVTKGQPLLILEAMKMEHTITAPADGVVKEIQYAAGEQVQEGAELITLE